MVGVGVEMLFTKGNAVPGTDSTNTLPLICPAASLLIVSLAMVNAPAPVSARSPQATLTSDGLNTADPLPSFRPRIVGAVKFGAETNVSNSRYFSALQTALLGV